MPRGNEARTKARNTLIVERGAALTLLPGVVSNHLAMGVFYPMRKSKKTRMDLDMEKKNQGELSRGKAREREKLLAEDRELVRRAKEKLYNKYLQKVFTYVYYRVGNVEDAEDITGNVFLHALLNLDRYEYRGLPFSSWLLRIAHNMVANWYRSKSREVWTRIEMGEEIEGGDGEGGGKDKSDAGYCQLAS